MPGRPTVLAAVAALLLLTGPAAAATAWATKANAVCRRVHAQQRPRVAKLQPPRTPAQAYAFARKVRVLEVELLKALEAVPGPRPPAAKRALALAHADIRELDAALQAYRTGSSTFRSKFSRWFNDRRADRAFIAAGARACAG